MRANQPKNEPRDVIHRYIDDTEWRRPQLQNIEGGRKMSELKRKSYLKTESSSTLFTSRICLKFPYGIPRKCGKLDRTVRLILVTMCLLTIILGLLDSIGKDDKLAFALATVPMLSQTNDFYMRSLYAKKQIEPRTFDIYILGAQIHPKVMFFRSVVSRLNRGKSNIATMRPTWIQLCCFYP